MDFSYSITKTEIASFEDIDFNEFGLKDIITVPLNDGDTIDFRVKHVEDDKLYFVSIGVVGNSDYDHINNILDDFHKKLPTELLSAIYGKIFIPSTDNIGLSNTFGEPAFNGFSSEISRVTSDAYGQTAYWWLRSDPSEPYFACVSYNGYIDYLSASYSIGVRPAFVIKRRNKV